MSFLEPRAEPPLKLRLTKPAQPQVTSCSPAITSFLQLSTRRSALGRLYSSLGALWSPTTPPYIRLSPFSKLHHSISLLELFMSPTSPPVLLHPKTKPTLTIELVAYILKLALPIVAWSTYRERYELVLACSLGHSSWTALA